MDIRQKRYSLDLKPRQKKFNVGLVVKIALIAAAVVAVIILAKYFYDLSQIRTSYLAGRDEITVGQDSDTDRGCKGRRHSHLYRKGHEQR